ncbi:MAG TPA: nucleoside-diphosphate kinase [Planctomycetota bacterium]|nr:nucleoside-diphosphate kinase [Planctomycetota bacterium]
MERTLILLKPDAVDRRLVGDIISRFERKGLLIVGLKLSRIALQTAEKHYEAHRGKPFYPGLVKFMTGGPVVMMALEGSRAVEVARKLMGKTFGHQAEPGTIRGDLGISSQYNLIHGSDSPESAERELRLFFAPGEILDYFTSDAKWHADE